MTDLLTDAKFTDEVHQIMFIRKELLPEIQNTLRTIILESKTVKEVITEAEKAERMLQTEAKEGQQSPVAIPMVALR